MEILFGGIFVWFLCACFGAWVACQKNRSGHEGFFLGVLFGPFGVLIEALLPNLDRMELVLKARRHERIPGADEPGAAMRFLRKISN